MQSAVFHHEVLTYLNIENTLVGKDDEEEEEIVRLFL